MASSNNTDSAAAASWTLTLHNHTSMAWFIQIAHALSVEPSSAHASSVTANVAAAAPSAQVLQTVLTQSTYAVPPEGGSDQIAVRLPGRYELVPLQPQSKSPTGSADLRVVTNAQPTASPMGRSFLLRDGSLIDRPFEPFVEAEAVSIATAGGAGSVGLLQEGSLIGGVSFQPSSVAAAASSLSTSVQLCLGGYFYRIVGTRAASLSRPISQRWAEEDWRPCVPSPSSGPTTVDKLQPGRGLVVHLRMNEDYALIYEEREEAVPVAAPTEADSVLSLVLTGDPASPSTQLAMLVLLEKQVAHSARFKPVWTGSLPLNHPYREGAHHPSTALLPYLTQRRCPRASTTTTSSSSSSSSRGAPSSSSSPPLLPGQSTDTRDVHVFARNIERVYCTGTKLDPHHVAAQKRMDEWIERIRDELMPNVEALLDELKFGPAQGHRSNPLAIEESCARLVPVLDDLSGTLAASPFLAGPNFSLADLTLLPFFSMLLLLDTSTATSAAAATTATAVSLVSDRPPLMRLVTSMQKRSSWQQLTRWQAKHQGTANQLAQSEDGVPFHT